MPFSLSYSVTGRREQKYCCVRLDKYEQEMAKMFHMRHLISLNMAFLYAVTYGTMKCIYIF